LDDNLFVLDDEIGLGFALAFYLKGLLEHRCHFRGVDSLDRFKGICLGDDVSDAMNWFVTRSRSLLLWWD
jgi:hypothetical protein